MDKHGAAYQNNLIYSTVSISSIGNIVTPVLTSILEFVRAACPGCGVQPSTISKEGDTFSSVIVRECDCGRSQEMSIDRDFSIHSCPLCGGVLLLSGSGFVGLESYSLGYTCLSCETKVRVSKRRSPTHGRADAGTMTLNEQFGRCA
jgi:hypothetical protein